MTQYLALIYLPKAAVNTHRLYIKTICHATCVGDASPQSNIHSISSLTPAAERCQNMRPCFWSSCARNAPGEKVKATWCTPRFPDDTAAEDEASMFWWPGSQTSATGPGLLSEPADLNLSALSFLGPFQSRRGLRSRCRLKGG